MARRGYEEVTAVISLSFRNFLTPRYLTQHPDGGVEGELFRENSLIRYLI